MIGLRKRQRAASLGALSGSRSNVLTSDMRRIKTAAHPFLTGGGSNLKKKICLKFLLGGMGGRLREGGHYGLCSLRETQNIPPYRER